MHLENPKYEILLFQNKTKYQCLGTIVLVPKLWCLPGGNVCMYYYLMSSESLYHESRKQHESTRSGGTRVLAPTHQNFGALVLFLSFKITFAYLLSNCIDVSEYSI